MKKSGLRGRGGAGFPTGVQMDVHPAEQYEAGLSDLQRGRSEPGTFKDRYIIHPDPHQADRGHGDFRLRGRRACRLHLHPRGISRECRGSSAIAERRKGISGQDIQGTGFDLEIYVHRGAGAYICGEETGLIESLEGSAPTRIKPPYFPPHWGCGCARRS
ncbi:MAG: hypothetical protein R3F11_03825 [Verrucomicrobiales bacterium]